MDINLTNENGRGIMRTPVACTFPEDSPENSFIGDIYSSRQQPGPEHIRRTSQQRLDCGGTGEEKRFAPSLRVNANRWPNPAGGSPNLEFHIAGEMNNGDAGYQSLEGLKLRLPQGMSGSLFPFANGERCPVNTPTMEWAFGNDPCARFMVGKVRVIAYAGQDVHNVNGFIYLSNPVVRGDLASLRFVFPKPPVRLNPLYASENQQCREADDEYNFNGLCPNPLSVTARLRFNPESNRIEMMIGELPMVYEVRNIDGELWGRPPTSMRSFLINQTSCGPRSFDADFSSDRMTSASASARYWVSDCNLAFTPSFRFKPFDTGIGGDNTTPGRAGGAAIIVNQPNGQAHMQSAEYTLAEGNRANSLLDDVTPCEAEDVEDCGNNRHSPSYIGSATATTPALDGAPSNMDTDIYGPLHLMKTDTGKPLKIASLLRGPYGIEIREEAYLKMRQTEPRSFAIVSGHTTPELPIRNFTAVFTKPVLKNPWLCQNNALESRAEFLSYSGLSHAASSTTNLTPCGQPDPLRPGLQYNPETTKAAAKTDLDVSITRQEGDQTTKRIALTLPPGWASDALTKPTCKDDQAELSACPPDSQIGTIRAKATIFKSIEPVVVDGGKVFHCERKGDDAGGICIEIPLPEIAGGGSLKLKGRILVTDNARKIQVVVDAIPTSIDTPEMEMEIKGSTTPSYCTPTQATTTVTGEADTQVQATSPYQSTGCDSVNFGPGLNVTHSSTEIERPTSIKTTITNAEGDATMERINLLFPKELKIDVFKLKTCSPAQRQASSCPSESHLGKAKIETPYLPNALEGDLHFGEQGRIYLDLSGLVKISLDGKIGIDQKSGSLNFKMEDIPPLLVSRAEITLDEDKVKNPKECSKATYKATFTSHSGKTSSSESSVDICGKRPTGEPTFGFKAKLKPKRKKRYTNATFTLTQKGENLKNVSSLNVKLGKGKKSLRIVKAALKRKTKSIGQVTLKPKGGKLQRAKLSIKRRKVRLRGIKGLKLKLKGKALKLTGLPKRPYKSIVIKLNGRKARYLRTPKAKGIVRFAAAVGIPGRKPVKLVSGVRVVR